MFLVTNQQKQLILTCDILGTGGHTYFCNDLLESSDCTLQLLFQAPMPSLTPGPSKLGRKLAHFCATNQQTFVMTCWKALIVLYNFYFEHQSQT
jgi:hypothetical protein